MATRNLAGTMSESLLNKDVYCVCCPTRDSLDTLQGELTTARKRFFTGGRKTVRIGRAEIVKGLEGRLSGKMSRRGLYWKKTAGKLALEEAFDQPNGYVVVCRDFKGIIVSRTYFDRNHLWVKSEYYEPWDSSVAQVIFKPVLSSNLVEQFDWMPEDKCYRSTELHSLPYLSGTAEQSLINAKFGEPGLIIATGNGEFCYCPKPEAQQRKEALDNIKNGTLVLLPAWEVRDGELAGNLKAEEAPADAELLNEPVEGASVEPETDHEGSPTEQENKPLAVFDGTPAEKANAALAQTGETGFDTRFAPGGSLTFAGFWKDGKKEGLGVSFRESDHALHVARWENGKPGETVSLFDKDGNLRYAGHIVGGRKEGAGVSIRQEDGTIFVGQWQDGQPTGLGSSFDKDGTLLYYGGWKDGVRSGHGTEFDASGAIVFDGEWKDDKYHNGILYQRLPEQGEQQS